MTSAPLGGDDQTRNKGRIFLCSRPCCWLPSATGAWIPNPVSRLEIVDSDLVVKREPGSVDGRPWRSKFTQAKREIVCQTRAWLLFITNFLICLCFNSFHHHHQKRDTEREGEKDKETETQTERRAEALPWLHLLSVINQEINKCVTGLCPSRDNELFVFLTGGQHLTKSMESSTRKGWKMRAWSYHLKDISQ